MPSVQYTVPNISCGHCVATIQRVVKEVAGVREVSGDVDARQVVVVYESPATPEAIVAAMTEWEYPPAQA
jgi:copper chaperone CopZ